MIITILLSIKKRSIHHNNYIILELAFKKTTTNK